jgi:hypothetical protein
LNYDLNFLKVVKLASEVRPTGLWPTLGMDGGAGGGAPTVRIRVLLYNPLVSRRNRSQRSCKHFMKIVKVVADWCPWFFLSLWSVFHVKILVSLRLI